MIKKAFIFFSFLCCVLFVSTTKAQYGNEWIAAGQNYWKIPVAEKGIYTIPFSTLSTAGISTSDPTKLQLWHRGVEQSILVNSNTVYFYGEANDGTLDSLIYNPMGAQFNKFYSLFSDTTYYFITVGTTNGKRLLTNSALAGTTQNFHMQTVTKVLTDEYSEGTLYSVETHLSHGDVGEGWMGPAINQSGATPNVSTNFLLPVTNLASSSSPTADLEIMLVGRNNQVHRIQILIGTNPNAPDASYILPDFYSYGTQKFKQAIPISLLTNNQPLSIFIKVVGSGFAPDRISVAHLILQYPQTLDVSAQNFTTLYPNKDNAGKSVTVAGVANGSFLWDISNEGSYTDVNYTLTSGTATFNLEAQSKKLVYAVPSSFKNIIGIQNVDLSPLSLGSEMLLITHQMLLSSTNEYANYKRSVKGGSLNVLVAEIHKLYNLYSYGEKHAIAIKRFVKQQTDLGSPKYLFLVGKGINLNYYGTTDSGNKYYRKEPLAFINNTYSYLDLSYKMEDLIPTYGFPASDLSYSIFDNSYKAKLPTGRLSARSNADVLQYLEKVKSNDDLDSNKLWRKHLIHLSGGKVASEIIEFKKAIDDFKLIAEGPLFGGKVVRSFTKDLSSGAVDQKLINSIAEELNKGVSYVTFYGHSSPNIIDLDIGKVSNPVYGYNNKDKYPLLFANGCQSAEFFTEGSLPEDWIMTPNKGAVLAMGHSHIGYTTYLKQYTEKFYDINFKDGRFKHSSVGEVQIKTIDTFRVVISQPEEIAQVTQFNLQGDPSIHIYKPSKTDYAISGDKEIGEKKAFLKSLDGKVVTAMSDAFSIGIPVINYGISSVKDVVFKVRHYVNGVLYKDYPLYSTSPILYCDTAYYTIPAKTEKLFGLNRIEITIDPRDSIKEFNENNNFATLEFSLSLSSITCLFPQEYSVVFNQPVKFVAQSNDLLQGDRDYYIEIDTSHLYNSPAKVVKLIRSGSLIKFNHTLLTDIVPSDSTVYYWRVRFNDLPSGDVPLWGESSFIYIKNSAPGWSQSEYPQFFKDTYHQMEMSATGKLSFQDTESRIYTFTQGNASGTSYFNVGIGVNDNAIISLLPGPGYCGPTNGCYVATFDKTTALPFIQDPSRQCGIFLDPKVHQFADLSNTGTQNALKTFLQNVKPNNYILIVSTGNMSADVWDPSLKSIFTATYGATQINSMGANTPYILLVKQGDNTPIAEVSSTDPSATIELNKTLVGKYYDGRITSTLIGPSSGWGTFYKTITPSGSDYSHVSIIRYNKSSLAVDTIDVPQIGDVNLAPLIDANQFPYIRLLMYASDTIDLTPPYFKKWQVIYSPVPEGTLNTQAVGVAQYKVTPKLNGEKFNLSFAFENISELDFAEPLKVVFTLRNDKGKINTETVVLGLLAPGESTTFNYTVNTKDFSGNASFQVYVNPRLQNEMYYYNNLLDIPFSIIEDKTHPIVDVMFDGIHIFDGDLVSPSPVISVSLNDNNPFLQFSDPNTLQVYLLRPGKSTPEQIDNTNRDVLKWGEDPDKKGKYIVEYNPKDLPDGKYKLIVQGKDASGNKSGTQSYEIQFEVVNASTMTNFYPYPNPFSTSTRFVFTLTGKEIPEDLKIQIMTVSGKVVREIMKHELGNIHIGNNITDFHWDGTDEFGDRLANGVYVYRVIIKNKADNFEHRETAGDKSFKKGYGKLYILR